MCCDWVRVEGKSMMPSLGEGDLIGVEWRDPAELRPLTPGDLVLGRASDNVWLVHRLVSQSSGGDIVIKGDASMQFEMLTASEVWGRVAAVRREGWKGARPRRTIWLDRVIATASRRRLRRVVYVLAFVRRVYD